MAVLMTGSGCGTTAGGGARYIDPTAGQGMTTVGDINAQDWSLASDEMIQSLLRSTAIDSEDGRRVVLMIGNIQNNTTARVDTDLLTKKIRIGLNRSGKVVTTTAVGLNGPEDESSMAVRELRGSSEFNQTTVAGQGEMVAHDYSLSGKIIQQSVRAGRTRSATYTFQLSLTDIRTGLAFWEDEREISKLGKKPAVSW